MPERPEVSIVIPCLNESGSIGSVVREAIAALQRLDYAGEVVVCDNGSTDGSAQEAEDAGARVVRQPIRGYGAACLRGVEAARGDYLVIVDGDGTYDVSLLHRFIEPLLAGYDMVVGTRRNGSIRPHVPWGSGTATFSSPCRRRSRGASSTSACRTCAAASAA
jgi:glycosyltransferase involved in cell wall biosynthesis